MPKVTTIIVMSLIVFFGLKKSTTAFSVTSSPQRIVRSKSSRWLAAAVAYTNNDRLFPEDLNIIYDSKCNVCKLEIEFLRRRDARVNGAARRLRFTDLEGDETTTTTTTNTGYNETDPANGGISYATGMAAMHAVTANGKILTGVPVFVEAYTAVGLGWLWRCTTWPVVSWLADKLYDLFAKYRTRITRGATVDQLVQAYQEKRALQAAQQHSSCDTGRCQVKTTFSSK